jgi:hypothetical protein
MQLVGNHVDIDSDIRDGVLNITSGIVVSFCETPILPVKFGIVKQNFVVNGVAAMNLKTLINCPTEVGMEFDVIRCTELRDLKGFPKYVGQHVLLPNMTHLRAEHFIPLLLATITGDIFIGETYKNGEGVVETILKDGRDKHGHIPRELVPTKINQLRGLDEDIEDQRNGR